MHWGIWMLWRIHVWMLCDRMLWGIHVWMLWDRMLRGVWILWAILESVAPSSRPWLHRRLRGPIVDSVAPSSTPWPQLRFRGLILDSLAGVSNVGRVSGRFFMKAIEE